jgi:hypothetical protein
MSSNPSPATGPADTVLFNGRIATQDERRSMVSALAIKEGRIYATGDNATVNAYRGAATRVIELNGRTVIPGLIDSHSHPIRGGLYYSLELRWDGVPSLADALRMLREQAQRAPPNHWVRVVGGWSEFQFAERRMPTLDEINAVAPDTPRMRPIRRAFSSVSWTNHGSNICVSTSACRWPTARCKHGCRHFTWAVNRRAYHICSHSASMKRARRSGPTGSQVCSIFSRRSGTTGTMWESPKEELRANAT